jgi:hypothetical protein
MDIRNMSSPGQNRGLRLERRLRLTLDFEVEVGEITEEAVRRYYRRHTNYEELMRDPGTWEMAARQNRLLLALLGDPEMLDSFLTFIVADEVCPGADVRLKEVLRVGQEEEVMETVYGRLGGEDTEFYREVSAEGLLWENMELVNESFRVRWAGGSLAEVREVRSLDGE